MNNNHFYKVSSGNNFSEYDKPPGFEGNFFLVIG